MGKPINIIFDGPPGPKSGRFVEVETDDGASVGVGDWIDRKNGLWAFRITELPEGPMDKSVEAKYIATVRVMATESLSPQYEQFERALDELCTTRHIDNETLAYCYIVLSGKKEHASDCATSQAPAHIPGPCDCNVNLPSDISPTSSEMECTKCKKVKSVNDFQTPDLCTECYDKEQDCPHCGSTIVDGKCSDVGGNNCVYTTE